jgi:hypothetical protein
VEFRGQAGLPDMRHQSRRLAAMVARADQQHAWVRARNECGIYGAAATEEIGQRRSPSEPIAPSPATTRFPRWRTH